MIVHKDLPSFNNRTPVQLKKVMNAVIDLILKIGKSGLSISASALRSVSKSLSASKPNKLKMKTKKKTTDEKMARIQKTCSSVSICLHHSSIVNRIIYNFFI